MVRVEACREGRSHGHTPLHKQRSPRSTRHPLTGQTGLSWFPISPALAAAGIPRAASTGHAHRLPPPRIITTAVKSLPPLCTSESSQRRLDPPLRADARTSRVIFVTAAPTPSYVGRRSSYTLLRRCTAGVNRAALTSHARHTTQRGQCWVTRTSTSTGGRWRADARRAASLRARCYAREGSGGRR